MSKPKKQLDDQALWDEVQAARKADTAKIAQLLWGENSIDLEEPEALGIGDSVLNTLKGRSIQDAITPDRYHPFDPANENFQRTTSFAEGHPYWSKYYQLAEKVMDPARQRSGIDHYYAAGSAVPYWDSDLLEKETRGRHIFGRMNPEVYRRQPAALAANKVKRTKASPPGGGGVVVKGKK